MKIEKIIHNSVFSTLNVDDRGCGVSGIHETLVQFLSKFFQRIEDDHLIGEIRTDIKPYLEYKVYEKEHKITYEYIRIAN